MDSTTRKALAHQRVEEHEQVSVRLAPHEMEQIDILVGAGYFLNRSDFLRSTVREKLASIRVETVHDHSRIEVEKEILAYLKEHPVAYPSDIAAERGIDLVLAMEVVQDLRKKGEIKEAKAR